MQTRAQLPTVFGSLLALVFAASALATEGNDQAQPDRLGDPDSDLVFTPLEPCRILDTRQPSPRSGQIAGGTSRDFYAFGVDFQSSQGGAAGNCGLTSAAEIDAVVINVAVVSPASAGFLTVWPAGGERPLASTVNYAANQTVANEIIAPITIPGLDVSIYSHRNAHVIADVVGYFARPQRAGLACSWVVGPDTSIVSGATLNASTAECPANSTLTGGACEHNINEVFVLSSTDILGTRWTCRFKNEALGTVSVRAKARCCSTPGR